MAIGFPAYFKDRRPLTISLDAAKVTALKALNKMECEELGFHPFALDFKTKGTLLTSGERIYVNITETEIIIRSECVFFSQIIDFGKNKTNVEAFWTAFDSFL